MNIKEILNYLIMLTQGPRQVGRTTALKEAADKIGGLLITTTVAEAKDLGGEAFSPHRLLGTRKPLILDHYFQTKIFGEAYRKIQELEDKLEAIKRIISD